MRDVCNATSAMPASPTRFNAPGQRDPNGFLLFARRRHYFVSSIVVRSQFKRQVGCPARQAARRSAKGDVMSLFASRQDHHHVGGAFFGMYP